MSNKNNTSYATITAAFKKLNMTSNTHRWQAVAFSSIDPLLDAWDGLSNRGKIKALKDSRWNHYPLCSWTPGSPKRYGSAIKAFVDRAISHSGKDYKLLEKYSEGVFALHTIDSSSSSVRISMAKRLKDSKDTRLRTRSVRILPIKYVPCFLNDKSYSVRNCAIKRLGVDNCYKEFLPKDESSLKANVPDGESYYALEWWRKWNSRQAIKLAETSEVEHLFPLLSKEGLDSSMVEALLSKIPREDILFYLEKSDMSVVAQKIISKKLT
jgi:hypothetical protein